MFEVLFSFFVAKLSSKSAKFETKKLLFLEGPKLKSGQKFAMFIGKLQLHFTPARHCYGA